LFEIHALSGVIWTGKDKHTRTGLMRVSMPSRGRTALCGTVDVMAIVKLIR
jgi:hypothetical protein